MRIQIAGIKTLGDALLAISANADSIGIVVGVTHESGDEVSADVAKDIFSRLPPFICRTLITHFTHEKEISDLIEYIMPTAVQLHSEDIELQTIIRLKAKYHFIKFLGVVHINTDITVKRAIELSKVSDAIFADTKANNRLGGTGIVHDWNMSAKICQLINKPFILAGGLTPDNILNALSIVKAYGVDVNTGVKENREFCFRKMKQFSIRAKFFAKSEHSAAQNDIIKVVLAF